MVVATSSWLAYREVRDTALDAAGRRLEDVAGQLVTLLAPSIQQRVAETRDVADDTAVPPALTAGAGTARARAVLQNLLEANEQIVAVALWDTAGRLVTQARRSTDDAPAPLEPPRWATPDTTSLGPFRERGGRAWYEVAAPVRTDGRTVGYVVQARQLASSPQAAQRITDLIGMDATFLIGGPGGTWTDLSRLVDGPPDVAGGLPQPLQYRRGASGRRLGAGAPLPGTSWIVWVEFPRDAVLEGSLAFLGWVLPIGFALVLFGGAGGWLLSRRVTARLSALTDIASAMAEGDYGRRVSVDGPDELGELAEAFNAMAAKVEHARHRLEGKVAERTAELRETEEQFRTLTVTAHEAIVIADGRGRITYVNPAAERIFGYPASEVVGQSLELLMPERYHEAHRAGFARYLATAEAHVIGRTLELEGRRKNGDEFPLELSVTSWRAGGEPAFAGIIRDVTRRKEHEAALRQYASDLEAANKELEAFSYSVSHDLRTPLRAMHGFSQALLEDYGDRLDAEGTDYLRRVCAGADRMGRLIDDLLELARASRVEMRRQPVDLSDLARRAVQDLRAEAPGRTVDVRIAEGLAVEADPRLLRLVLDNLLGNAWKFTAKRARATIEVGATNGGDTFYVRDDGAGFDMTYADKLFGAFQRLHAPSDFSGTGVGLALVQRIIHRHGGRVWAEAAVDRGATFYFTLAGS